MTLGAPSYTYQYSNQTSGIKAGTRSISGLNLKTDENTNPDGITPNQLHEFMQTVMSTLGITTGATYPKLITNQIYDADN